MKKLCDIQLELLQSWAEILSDLWISHKWNQIIQDTKNQIHIWLQNFFPRIYATDTEQLKLNFKKAIDISLSDVLYFTPSQFIQFCTEWDNHINPVLYFSFQYRKRMLDAIENAF